MSYWKNLLSLDIQRVQPKPEPKPEPKPKIGAAHRRRLVIAMCLIPALLTTQQAIAKFEDYLTNRWFTIEVIVFERSNIDDKNTLEALTQPRQMTDEALLLQTQLALGELDESADEELAQTSITQDPQDLLAEPPALVSRREPTEQRLNLETPFANDKPAAEAARLDFLDAIIAYEQALEARNLRFVSDENPRLEEELARLSRPRNNNIVWRGHWLQAVPNRQEPEPLEVAVNELESGEFQLTGSIEVTVNRYLHLHAQLEYHDPAFSDALVDAELTNASFTQGIGGEAEAMQSADATRSQQAQMAYDNTQSADPNSPMPKLTQAGLEPAQPIPWFMQLDEKRRMRSGYLHYLDHPKLGLLVRIDKLTTPQELLDQHQLFESSQE